MIDNLSDIKHIDSIICDIIINFKIENNNLVIIYVSKMIFISESELLFKSRYSIDETLITEETRDLTRRKKEKLTKFQIEFNKN